MNIKSDERPEPPNENMWWCPECVEWVSPYDVTYYEMHDVRHGGCGHKCE